MSTSASFVASLIRKTLIVSLATVVLSMAAVVMFDLYALQQETATLRANHLRETRDRLQALVTEAVRFAHYQRQLLAVDAAEGVEAARRERAAQRRVLEWLEIRNTGSDYRTFAGRWDGVSLLGPARGRQVLELTDDGAPTVMRDLIRVAQSGGGFVEYVMPAFPGWRAAPKLSYVEPIAPWGWYIGAGCLLDRLDEVVAERRAAVNAELGVKLLALAVGLVIILWLVYVLTRRLSRHARADVLAFINFFATANTDPDVGLEPARMRFRESALIARAAARMIAQRRATEAALRESEGRFRTLIEVQQYAVMELDLDGRIRYVNPAVSRLLGYTRTELERMRVSELVVESERDALERDLRRFARLQPPPTTYFNRNRTRDGRVIELQVEWNYRRDDQGRVVGFISVAHDVTDYHRSRLLLDGRNRVLEMLARGRPQQAVLEAIIDYVERVSPQALCSIHRYDGATRTLHNAAARRLPEHYMHAIDGMVVGPAVGSCGHAASLGKRVVVADLLEHPFWEGLRELLLTTELRACWSQPIIAPDATVLGTFAIYAHEVSVPSPDDIALIESAAELAAIVMEHARVERATRLAEERARLLLDSSTEGVFGLDLEARTTFVNPAAARLLGFSAEALTGRAIHELIHHSRPDGEPITSLDSPMLRAMREGRGYHVTDAVFWRADGGHFPVEYWSTPILREGRIEGAVVTFHDISERKRVEAEIQHLAFHDSLTGLPNRLLFKEEVGRALALLRREGQRFALHMLDLDHFKDVNDSLGHPVGDELLCAVAHRIRGVVRASDVFARFGGDEFALLQVPITHPAEAAALADKVVGIFSEHFALGACAINTNTSIGIAIADRQDLSVDDLIARADVALYKAKEAGRGTHAFFADTMTDQLRHELEIASELVRAVDHDELCLHYQPQVDLRSGALVGVEALVRWQHPERGLLQPGAFIDIAERRGMIRPLSAWVLEAVCRQARAWRERGLVFGRVAVNLCAQQVADDAFAEQILAVLERTGARPEELELEFTETVLIQADARTQADIIRLSEIGVRFAIDDFGTGFSSLQYLRNLRADKIKIDREFVKDVTHNPSDAEIVKATIALGVALGLETIAEGVETEAQAAFLRRHGCHQVQGFLYARPLGVEVLERDWLTRRCPPHAADAP
ncbi:EAL domain-containing protein [Marichromatium bheemlicum]|uniref:EAL domain-containing protein n=1 Tax=Marichromatium bheemlicum TaxID=365339 RepID=A0ABX1I9F4_9GAMM|nr:EAL domain-containing protein [Marichromatium bheemlicum]NKN33604.1 EAL domain-containing protein [Marichromatium bheemlicum]